MKKILALLISVLLLTGCSKVDFSEQYKNMQIGSALDSYQLDLRVSGKISGKAVNDYYKISNYKNEEYKITKNRSVYYVVNGITYEECGNENNNLKAQMDKIKDMFGLSSTEESEVQETNVAETESSADSTTNSGTTTDNSANDTKEEAVISKDAVQSMIDKYFKNAGAASNDVGNKNNSSASEKNVQSSTRSEDDKIEYIRTNEKIFNDTELLLDGLNNLKSSKKTKNDLNNEKLTTYKVNVKEEYAQRLINKLGYTETVKEASGVVYIKDNKVYRIVYNINNARISATFFRINEIDKLEIDFE